MNLHAQIMNLPADPAVEAMEYSARILWKVGHRYARHAAAELALKADAERTELLAALLGILKLDTGDEPGLWPFERELDIAREAVKRATGETP